MHRILVSLSLLLFGCGFAPFSWGLGPAKQLTPKPSAIAALPPRPHSLGLAAPPPPVRLAAAALPAGHLSPASFNALTLGAVPQARDPRGLFDRSRNVVAERVSGGLLVCSVHVTGHGYDDGFFAGGADVYMTLRVAGGAPRRSPHRSLRIFTLPTEELERGDTLSVTVMDDDVFSDDLIGRGAATYDGTETRIDAAPGAQVVCRPVAATVVERERERALSAVRRSVDRLSRAEPDPLAYDFGYRAPRSAEVIAAVRDALALMALSDDALQAEVDRAIAFEDAWQAATQDAIESRAAELAPPGDAVRVARLGAVRVERFACGAEAGDAREELNVVLRSGSGCIARLEIEPQRHQAVDPGQGPFEMWGIQPDGSMVTATMEATRASGSPWSAAPTTLRRGETTTFAVTFPPGARPRLLRLRDGGRAALIRLD